MPSVFSHIRRKNIIIGILSAVFFLSVPLIIFYSSGYSLRTGFHVVKTGGINLLFLPGGSSVSVDGKFYKKIPVFSDQLFIQGLNTGIHTIRAEKENYYPWIKRLEIKAQKVAVGYVLLVPVNPEIKNIPRYIPITGRKPGVDGQSRQYADLSVILQKNNITGKIRIKKKVVIWREGKRIFARWKGRKKMTPEFLVDNFFFKKNLIYQAKGEILDFDFYPGRNDTILISEHGHGIFTLEMDKRPPYQNAHKIMVNACNFAVINDIIYVHENEKIILVRLE
ncbi:MAG: hypothetical protein A2096_06345 [Spirochaetes bacterium GWF1_41_5]|nr:MAG: hypothetical protein A2096_06345 [Spirochaetes bacterium GWF1_41_5]HBE02323.1 hypothetical protein [Spirochaetia bacterium]